MRRKVADDSTEPTRERIDAADKKPRSGTDTSGCMRRLGSAETPRDIRARRAATLRQPPFELAPAVMHNGSVRIDERNWGYCWVAIVSYTAFLGVVLGCSLWVTYGSVKGPIVYAPVALFAILFLPLCGYFVADAFLTGRIVTIDQRQRSARVRGRGLRRSRWTDDVYPLGECEWRVYRADVSISGPKRATIQIDGWMVVFSATDQAVAVAVLRDEHAARDALRRWLQAVPLRVVDTDCEVSWRMRV